MNLIDAHCHLANLAETHDVKLLIDEAKAQGISTFISGALTQKELSWHQNNPVAEVYWHAGIHPNFPDCDLELPSLENLLKADQIVAVGEIGLDRGNPELNSQIDVFQSQLELAQKYCKPVVLHIVGHQTPSYKLLQQYPLRCLVHGYAGSLEGFQLLARHDTWFTISSRILKEDKRGLLSAILRRGRFMFETDITQYYVHEGEANPLLRLLDVLRRTVELGIYNENQLLEIQAESFSALFGDHS